MLDNNVVSIERFFNRIDESQTVEPRVIERLDRYSRNVFSSSGVGEEFEKDVWDVCNLIRVFRGVNGKKCNIYFGENAGVDTLKTLCALYIINSKSKSTGNIQRHCKSIIDLSMEVDLSEVSHERFLQNYNIKMNEMQGRGLSLSSLRRFHLSAKLTLDYLCGRAIGTKSHKENRNSCNERYIINPNLVYVDLSPLKKKFEVTTHISGNVRKGSMDLLRRTRDLMISVDDLISALMIISQNYNKLSSFDKLIANYTRMQMLLGARTSEILSMPRDCLVYDDDHVLLRVYAAKVARTGTRIIGRAGENYSKSVINTVGDIKSLFHETASNACIVYDAIKEGRPIFEVESFDAPLIKIRAKDMDRSRSKVSEVERLRKKTFDNESVSEYSLKSINILVKITDVLPMLFYEEKVLTDDEWISLGYESRFLLKDAVAAITPIYRIRSSNAPSSMRYVVLDDIEFVIKASFKAVNSKLRETDYFTHKLHNALFIVPQGAASPGERTRRWMFNVLSNANVAGFFSGHNRKQSAFHEYGLIGHDEQVDIKFGHAYRRLITTDLLNSGLQGVVVAKWMGRTGEVQNLEYEYNNTAIKQLEEKVQSALLGEADVGQVLEGIDPTEIDVLTPEALIGKLAFQVRETPYGGLCFHDFALSECKSHLKCYNGCDKFSLKTGDADGRMLDRKSIFTREVDGCELAIDALLVGESQYGDDLDTAKYFTDAIKREEIKRDNLITCIDLLNDDDGFVLPFSNNKTGCDER